MDPRTLLKEILNSLTLSLDNKENDHDELADKLEDLSEWVRRKGDCKLLMREEDGWTILAAGYRIKRGDESVHAYTEVVARYRAACKDWPVDALIFNDNDPDGAYVAYVPNTKEDNNA